MKFKIGKFTIEDLEVEVGEGFKINWALVAGVGGLVVVSGGAIFLAGAVIASGSAVPAAGTVLTVARFAPAGALLLKVMSKVRS